MIYSLNIFNHFFKIINNTKLKKIISTSYILFISYDFVDDINIYFYGYLCSIHFSFVIIKYIF